jgi:hypothetical protein
MMYSEKKRSPVSVAILLHLEWYIVNPGILGKERRSEVQYG